MYDIWDSPVWQSLKHFTTTQKNLIFSFFINWFNPFSNKIGGKTVSCGTIMMFCLNFPYYLQHKPENTFFSGITPPPHEPSVVTITALLNPLVEQLQLFYSGIIIWTYCHPTGTMILSQTSFGHISMNNGSFSTI